MGSGNVTLKEALKTVKKIEREEEKDDKRREWEIGFSA